MSAVSEVFSPPKIKNAKRVLCVQPHPDDNEIGMGGTVAYYASHGCEVSYLTVTNGDYGSPSPDISREEIAAIRETETRLAGGRLGVKQFFSLGYRDCECESVHELSKAVARVIQQTRPEIVFCPDPFARYEAHTDHIITGRAVSQAVMLASLCGYPDADAVPHAACAIAYYYTQKPNRFISTTRFFKTKFEAVALHKSQITAELLDSYKLFFKLIGLRYGLFRFKGVAEGFRVLSPLHLHCFPLAHKI